MIVIVVICDRCRREAPPNTRTALLKRLGWRIRKKDEDPRLPDLCPVCHRK